MPANRSRRLQPRTRRIGSRRVPIAPLVVVPELGGSSPTDSFTWLATTTSSAWSRRYAERSAVSNQSLISSSESNSGKGSVSLGLTLPILACGDQGDHPSTSVLTMIRSGLPASVDPAPDTSCHRPGSGPDRSFSRGRHPPKPHALLTSQGGVRPRCVAQRPMKYPSGRSAQMLASLVVTDQATPEAAPRQKRDS
jgi:hypothetical protein